MKIKQKHYTIPIFIPELACPFQCIYCNQKTITSVLKSPSVDEVEKIINQHFKTLPIDNSFIEIGFFGGNFTGIDIKMQKEYLAIAKKYLLKGLVKGIRLSTRPDYIDNEKLNILKDFGVTTIELGAQSFSDEVLLNSKRGHTAYDIEKASLLIKENDFNLGLQMMVGLPSDNKEKSIYTAKKIIEAGASETRIYPLIVIKDTELESLYFQKKYNPISLDGAIDICKDIYLIFENAGVKVIRMGLHPSEDLVNGTGIVAGPFHRQFKELVFTEIWNEMLCKIKNTEAKEKITIAVSPYQINYAVGYKSKNKLMLAQKFKNVDFVIDDSLKDREFKLI